MRRVDLDRQHRSDQGPAPARDHDADLPRTHDRQYDWEGKLSHYREAFRMIVPNDVQGALNRVCGDRVLDIGDYRGIVDSLDYPCRLELPQQQIDATANALRADARPVPLLRQRIADIGTRLRDLAVNNRDVLQGLQDVSEGAP